MGERIREAIGLTPWAGQCDGWLGVVCPSVKARDLDDARNGGQQRFCPAARTRCSLFPSIS